MHRWFIVVLLTLQCLFATSLVLPENQWHLIGNNAPDASLKDIVDSGCVESIWGYDSLLRQWYAFSPQDSLQALIEESSIPQLETIGFQKGFWVKTSKTCSLNLGLTKTRKTDVNILQGWNLHSVPVNINLTESDTMMQASHIKLIWEYIPAESSWHVYSPQEEIRQRIAQSQYATISTLYADKGYWFLSDSNGSIALPSVYKGPSETLEANLSELFVLENADFDENKSYFDLTQEELKKIETSFSKTTIALLKTTIALNSTLFLDPSLNTQERFIERNRMAQQALQELNATNQIALSEITTVETLLARRLNRTLSAPLDTNEIVTDNGPLSMLKSVYTKLNSTIFSLFDTTTQIAEHFADQKDVAESLAFMERMANDVKESSFFTVQALGTFATGGSAGAAVAATTALSKLQTAGKVLSIASSGLSTLSSVVKVTKAKADFYLGSGNSVTQFLEHDAFKMISYVEEGTNLLAIGNVAKNGLKGFKTVADAAETLSFATYLTTKEIDRALEGKIELGATTFKISGAQIDYKNTLAEIFSKQNENYQDAPSVDTVDDPRLPLYEGNYIDYHDQNRSVKSRGLSDALQATFHETLKGVIESVNENQSDITEPLTPRFHAKRDYEILSACTGDVTSTEWEKRCKITIANGDKANYYADKYDIQFYSRYVNGSLERITEYEIIRRYYPETQKWTYTSLIKKVIETTNNITTREQDYYDGKLILDKKYDAQSGALKYYAKFVVPSLQQQSMLVYDFEALNNTERYFDIAQLDETYFTSVLVLTVTRTNTHSLLFVARDGWHVSSETVSASSNQKRLDVFPLERKRWTNNQLTWHEVYETINDSTLGDLEFSLLRYEFENGAIRYYDIHKNGYNSKTGDTALVNHGYASVPTKEIVLASSSSMNAPITQMTEYVTVEDANGTIKSIPTRWQSFYTDGRLSGYTLYTPYRTPEGSYIASKIYGYTPYAFYNDGQKRLLEKEEKMCEVKFNSSNQLYNSYCLQMVEHYSDGTVSTTNYTLTQDTSGNWNYVRQ